MTSRGGVPQPAPDLRLRRVLAAGVWAKLPQDLQSRLRAVLLTGSVGRGEGTWLGGQGLVRLIGDADALLVFDAGVTLPTLEALARLEAHVAARLREHGIHAAVSIRAVRPAYLRGLPSTIFGYELRHGGQCIWGDPAILRLIPECSRRAIPREDAWRLLNNRVLEALLGAWPLGGAGSRHAAPDTVDAVYPWVKLHLDLATSYLVFCSEYEPSYAARALRLHAHWGRAGASAPPLAPDFAARVVACTEWKLAPDATAGRLGNVAQLSARGLEDARALWLWEMEQMTGVAASAKSRGELWRRWLRSRSWASRARGWASAARRLGPASVRLTPRWARLCAYATPRHWIYQAASELLFGLDGAGRLKTTPGGNLRFDPARLAAHLPLPAAVPPRDPNSIESLLQQLKDNYSLVQTTRT